MPMQARQNIQMAENCKKNKRLKTILNNNNNRNNECNV